MEPARIDSPIHRRREHKHGQRRRGVTLVLVTLMLVPMVAMLAFAIDYGYLLKAESDLQRCADAAVLACVQDLVPASVQVCSPHQLRYFPRHIVLSDTSRFDLDQPQRQMAESASKAGVKCLDLRQAFFQDPHFCPFHPDNLHWTAEGHIQVANFLATRLTIEEGRENLDQMLETRAR